MFYFLRKRILNPMLSLVSTCKHYRARTPSWCNANIYADLGYREARSAFANARLVGRVAVFLAEGRIPQTQAATVPSMMRSALALSP